MLESEKEALFSVLGSLVGSEWNVTEIYPDPCGYTPIQGSSCDQFGDFWFVTVLNLGAVYDNSLRCSDSASIHPALFSLGHLKTLSFYMCFNWAPQIMPSRGWKNLSNSMQSLTFRSNGALVGELPSELCELRNLENLVVKENNMKGSLPEELGRLHTLKKLVLSRNQFCGQIPPSIGNLENLLILDLSFNRLTGILPYEIVGLKSVMKMDLSDNFIRGQIPLELGDLKNVTLLDLRNNRLHGSLPKTLIDMSNLQELYLGTNPIGGNISLAWDKLPKLMSFDLSTSNYEGGIPESLGLSKGLRYIALNGNRLSGVIPSKLAEIPSLNTLYLNGNNFSGTVVFTESFCRRLGRRLALWNNSPGLCYEGSGMITPHGISSCSSESSKAASHGSSSPASFVSPGMKRYDVEYVSVLLLLLLPIGILMAQQP
jgi:hypothetical protein